MNKSKCIKYRDTWAAPGSELHRILTEEKPAPAGRREAKALKHWQKLEAERRVLEEGKKVALTPLLVDVWGQTSDGRVTCNGIVC